MIRLAAFADEISPDLDEQIAVLREEGISHVELRGVWNTNVLDLSDAQVGEIRRALGAHGMRVASIGSPIGKVPVDSAFDEHLQRFERALALARTFGARYVRIFSFYPPAGAAAQVDAGDQTAFDWAPHRAEVLRRLREMAARARAADVVLLHENEKDIYGDTIARCVDLLRTVDNPNLGAAFDPANFIQCGQQPYPGAYDALRPWVRYVHVKDALPEGQVVAPGEGTARWPDLLQHLRADGYDGFFSLEPHLAEAGRFRGFSGPERFRHASRAFQGLLQALNWTYE